MPAKYVLSQKPSGYHWNLMATDGRVIASSEVYTSKAAAMTGIRSVQRNGATEVIVTEEELKASRAPAKRSAAKPVKRAAATAKTTRKAPASARAKAKAT